MPNLEVDDYFIDFHVAHRDGMLHWRRLACSVFDEDFETQVYRHRRRRRIGCS
ncbi:MAG: hypothetical protein U0Q12_02830 [Vicinamibacterales bacterium]